MRAQITIEGQSYKCDLKSGTDISIALHPQGPRAWYVGPMRIEPVRGEQFTGSVAEGGSVNFRDVHFNPHAHGTHTECLGHISTELHSVHDLLDRYFFSAWLCSPRCKPLHEGRDEGGKNAQVQDDKIIDEAELASLLEGTPKVEALICRSRPNDPSKLHRNYSHSNPPYFSAAAIHYLRKRGVEHLLTDLPSVDREEDGGRLAAHRAFWQGEDPKDLRRTITEFIYVPDGLPDGLYLLNLQLAPLVNDASPSRPVIFPLQKG